MTKNGGACPLVMAYFAGSVTPFNAMKTPRVNGLLKMSKFASGENRKAELREKVT